jgi:MFS family permease
MKKKVPLILTIFLATFALVADFVVIPASGEIFAAFPNANPILLNFILTGPLFASVFGAIVAGFVAKVISKKNILIIAQVVFTIAACGGALFNNVYYIALMRGIVGFSYGIIGVITLALISELFEIEKERGFMMGGYNGALAVLGVITSVLSGYLAVKNWHNSFYVYLIAIPVLILIIVFIPKTPPEGKLQPNEPIAEASEKKSSIWKVAPLALSLLVFNALYYILLYYIAFFVEETSIGDASTAGIYASLGTAGLFVSSLLFAFIYNKFERATPIIFYVVAGLAYIVMYFSHNVWVVGIMCLLAGSASGLAMAYYFMRTSVVVPLSIVSLAMAIITSCLSLGGFLSSFALTLYQTIMNVSTIVPVFFAVGITLLFGGVVSFILTLRAKRIGEKAAD